MSFEGRSHSPDGNVARIDMLDTVRDILIDYT